MSESAGFQLDRIFDETFVEQVDFFAELESTNDRALALAEEGRSQSPLLVLTGQQTKGRGRGTNQWYSTGGSLTFSLLVQLGDVPSERLPQISLTVGVALCQAIEAVTPQGDVALKWPNDVFLDGRKLAGVLIELPPTRQRQAVIGVGINVNNSLKNAPAEVVASAISLRDRAEAEFDLNEILLGCLQSLERHLTAFRSPSNQLSEQWNAYHLLDGCQLELEVYSRQAKGVCVGIDHDGALLLRTETGVERFLGGVVTRFEPS